MIGLAMMTILLVWWLRLVDERARRRKSLVRVGALSNSVWGPYRKGDR